MVCLQTVHFTPGCCSTLVENRWSSSLSSQFMLIVTNVSLHRIMCFACVYPEFLWTPFLSSPLVVSSFFFWSHLMECLSHLPVPVSYVFPSPMPHMISTCLQDSAHSVVLFNWCGRIGPRNNDIMSFFDLYPSPLFTHLSVLFAFLTASRHWDDGF